MKINKLNFSENAKKIGSKMKNAGIVLGLVGALTACDGDAHQKTPEKTDTPETTTHFVEERNENTESSFNLFDLQLLQNEYKEILSKKGEVCYRVDRAGENLGGEAPSTRYFFSQEEVDEYIKDDANNWEVVENKVDEKTILTILENNLYSAVDMNTFRFWEAAVQKYKAKHNQ